jgi:DNA-binding response OmpR family regulator
MQVDGAVRVFVIEDHPRVAEALRAFLRASGFTVHMAHDLKTGLKQLRTTDFDVLLCDLHLPDGTGWDLMKKLHDQKPNVRAIAFSAFDDSFDRERSRSAGFVEHLSKATPPTELVVALRRVAQRGNQSAEVSPADSKTVSSRSRPKRSL